MVFKAVRNWTRSLREKMPRQIRDARTEPEGRIYRLGREQAKNELEKDC